MTASVEHVDAGGGEVGPRALGPDPQASHVRRPVPGAHRDILHGPAVRTNALQPHDLVVVGLGVVDPFAVGAPRWGQRQPATGQQHRWAGQLDVVHAKIPAVLGGPVEREGPSVGSQGGTRHRRDAPRGQHSRLGTVGRTQLDAVAAALDEREEAAVGARLRLHLDPRLAGQRPRFAGFEVYRPHVQSPGAPGGVEEGAAVGRERGIEVESGAVDGADVGAGHRVDDDDAGVAVVVAHQGQPVAGGMPRRTGIHVASLRELTRGSGRDVHDPDPPPRRKRDVPPVRRRCRIDGSVREHRELVAFEVDVMTVSLDVGVAIPPLTGRGVGKNGEGGRNGGACGPWRRNLHGIAPGGVGGVSIAKPGRVRQGWPNEHYLPEARSHGPTGGMPQ